MQQCIRLPLEKLTALLSLLKLWEGKKKCTKRDILSLIGSLSFAAKVVKPGRMFLRRLIDLSSTVKKLHHHISLSSEARKDISWWSTFLPSWNGVSLFQEELVSSVSLNLFTDASNLGIGGTLGNKWFSCEWPAGFLQFHINFKEVFAIYVAIATWATHLRNKQIVVFCDNLAIVSVWKSGTCKEPRIMKIIRALFFLCASNNTNLICQHIEGHNNVHADFLSRLQVNRFLAAHPDADNSPSRIPTEVWDI